MAIKLTELAVRNCPKCDCDMDEYSIDGVRFLLCCNCEHKIMLAEEEEA